MAIENSTSTNNKLVLMNDHLFVRVYTAGTNVKKFTQQADKNNQSTNIIEVCKFVLRLVESRSLPLEVCAKIVCGMGRIRLYHLQKLFAEFTVLSQKSSLDRRIGYGEKNVVRQMKVQVECKTKGKGCNSNTADPLDFDLGVVNFDLDIKEQITEKEVIFSLVSCKNATTVTNVQDITMRDEPRVGDYSVQQYDRDEDDFGAALSSEMLDFFSSNDERDDDAGADAVPIHASPAITQQMDIELPVEPDIDMPNEINQEILPLKDTLEPVPILMESSVIETDAQIMLPPLACNNSYEGSIPEGNDDASSNISLPEETALQQGTEEVVKSTGAVRKRRLIIDAHTQLSYKCLQQRISNKPGSLAKLQRPNPKEELSALLAEVRLENLFTKPTRPWLFSFMFQPPEPKAAIVKRKASFAEHELNPTKRSNPARVTTAGNFTPGRINYEEPYNNCILEPPIQPTANEPPQPNTSTNPVDGTEMHDFLTSFTGNPSQWNFLKSCEPSASEPDKHKKNDEGVVTRYAAVKVLESMFDSVPDNCVQFELLQSKMSNRLIAASLFGKLLDLSKDKTILVSTDERGTPVRVHKYMNWQGA